MRIGIKRDIERYRLIGGYGGKEGKREEKRYQGKGGVATTWQPLGNQAATIRQPKVLILISRDRIGPLATVAKFPWKWYDFLPIPGPTKLQKESPGVTTGYILLFTFSKIHVKIYMSYIKDGCCNGSIHLSGSARIEIIKIFVKL